MFCIFNIENMVIKNVGVVYEPSLHRLNILYCLCIKLQTVRVSRKLFIIMQEDVNHWIDISNYDYETAEAMLKSGRYLYVLFCCQQSVEKRLKAILLHKTSQMPPKTHDLAKLALLADLKLTDEQKLFLHRLSNYYIETRYPEEVKELVRQVDKSLSEKYFHETGEMIKCLDKFLK